MASVKQQVRLLLDPATASQLHQLSLRESRSLASTCMVLIKESLANRRSVSASTERLVRAIRGQADDFPATS
jgi:hypothetical protein